MNLDKYNNIIWDWNGTLLDDRWLCLSIINKICKKANLAPISDNEYLEKFNFPVMQFYQELGFNFNKISFKEIAKIYIREYEQKKNNCLLRKQARIVLQYFQKSKKKQYILSAYSHKELVEIINYYKITTFFKKISGLDNHYADSKLKNGIKMMNLYQLKPEETIIIGDTTHDFEVASSLKIYSILIENGHQSKEKLEHCKTLIIKDLNELLK